MEAAAASAAPAHGTPRRGGALDSGPRPVHLTVTGGPVAAGKAVRVGPGSGSAPVLRVSA